MKSVKTRSVAGGEFELIAELARELSRFGSRHVEVGIGDDAAVLRGSPRKLLVSVDDQVEGVHFDLRWLTPEDVGYRSLQAAASDLAAMGAAPLGAVASLHVPAGFPRAKLRDLARGQLAAARRLGCPVIGGNIARGPCLSVTTTVLGRASRPLLRSGARAGDELWLVGELGWARAGLLLNQRRISLPRRLAAVAERARTAWARPEALVEEGRKLVGRARAVMDVSDGLAGDLRHLAEASGVKAIVEAARLERCVSVELAELGDLLGEPATLLALRGGEDYALLCAGPRARRPRSAKVIGRIERGRGAHLELESGQRFALRSGFDHLGG
jgi:thiamine-monophosphate kinase